jgi:hypothetical protein
MTLDAIDAAFVRRWHAVGAPTPSLDAPALDPPSVNTRPASPDASAALSERLVAAAWPEWVALAGHVEKARMRGRRVIAIAGHERGEGRTTLVGCLGEILRSRGREVHIAAPGDLASDGTTGALDERPHDRRIILLDGGVWFPPGPLHRQRLLINSLGVDAAILVRRHDRPGGTARQAALESLGIEVLGEVLTFTPTCEPDAAQDGEPAR